MTRVGQLRNDELIREVLFVKRGLSRRDFLLLFVLRSMLVLLVSQLTTFPITVAVSAFLFANVCFWRLKEAQWPLAAALTVIFSACATISFSVTNHFGVFIYYVMPTEFTMGQAPYDLGAIPTVVQIGRAVFLGSTFVTAAALLVLSVFGSAAAPDTLTEVRAPGSASLGRTGFALRMFGAALIGSAAALCVVLAALASGRALGSAALPLVLLAAISLALLVAIIFFTIRRLQDAGAHALWVIPMVLCLLFAGFGHPVVQVFVMRWLTLHLFDTLGVERTSRFLTLVQRPVSLAFEPVRILSLLGIAFLYFAPGASQSRARA